MLQFKELIESHLEIINKNIEIKMDNEIIKRKSNKYDNLVNKAPIGIFETTSNGKIISINESMAEILGFSSIDETLKHYNDLKKDLYLNQKRREEFIMELNENDEVKNFEYQAIGKNEVHKWISMNAIKSRTKEDGTYVIEGFVFDVTERKDKEEKIREQKEELAAAFEQLTAYNEEVMAMNEELEQSFTRELITSIIKIMEMYDLYTKGHSENVAKIAAAIAKEMNLPETTIRNTYWAGLVHDIGKLLIPLDIINKKGKLTDKEYELIKKHPVWGSKALSSSETLKPIAKYLLYHHERWDGRGYPEGLKEEEIPVISQILGVADAWDAMLSKRAYRNSLSFEKAVAEIKSNKGSQFSPQVADTFIRIIEDDKIDQLKLDILDDEISDSKIENQILKRNEDYKELFQKTEEGIVIVDEDFHIIKVNDYFIEMFGYDEQKIIGENIKKIVPIDRTRETDNYIYKLSQGENVNSRTIREKANGELIDVSIQAFPVSLEEENMGYYIIYRDITELKETKSKYKNIKDRYKALFENDYTVMLIIDPDNGKIVDANPAAVNFYGWSKEESTSMKISDINVLNKEEVKKEMEEAREKSKNYFNFKHRTVNEEAKDVEVYSQPIPFAEKEYLYSIIHEKK